MVLTNEQPANDSAIPRSKSTSTITRDLVAGLILVVILVSALAMAFNYWVVMTQGRRQIEQKADEYLAYLINSLELPIWDYNEESVRKIGQAYFNNDMVAWLRVIEENGGVLFSAEKEPPETGIGRVGAIHHEGRLLGRVELGLTTRQYEENNRRLLRASLLLMVATLGAIALATTLLVQVFLRKPMDMLIKGIERLAAGDYDHRFPVPRQREIELITGKFLNMAAEIQAREQSLGAVNERLAAEILEHKKAEQALSRSEERYRTLMEAAPDPVAVYEPSGRILYVNPAFTRALGWSLERLETKTIHDLVVMENNALCQLDQGWEEERSFSGLEALAECQNGARVRISMSTAVFRGADGQVAGCVLTLRDITERKRMEEELRQTRNYLQNVVNSMPSVLVGVDLGGQVTQWNVEAQRVTGLSSEEALGRPLGDVFPALARRMDRVRECIEDRTPRKTERIMTEEDGETRISDMMVYPLVANGVRGAVIRMDDVTARVRIEEMMVQTEKMMSVGGLAAGMAHEINNPLGGILLGAHNVLRRFHSDLEKNVETARECGFGMDQLIQYVEKRKIRSFLEGIIASGERAAAIVTNMLQFSRRSESQKVPTSLPELLDRTVDLAGSDYDLKKQFDFRHIDIRREYAPDLPLVPCESSKISQVVLNLLKNAAQAMSLNPDQDKRSPVILLRTAREGAMARFEVEDNGPGMDERTRKRVFEPFFTTKGVGVGTGLGLSVSYFIIHENHGGRMSVESSPGKGARFIVHLPL